MSKSGYSSRELGKLAEETFNNLLKYWFGRDATNSSLSPDWQGVDLRTQIRSSRSNLETIHINWQIKSRSVESSRSNIYGERAFRIGIKKSEYNSIISACGSEDYFYVVLAIPNADVEELYRLNDIDKFSWYAIDVKQYIRALKIKDKTTEFSSIFIPESNKLSLSTVSLLWGSLWMDKMLGRLSKSVHFVSRDLWNFLITSPYARSVNKSDIQKGRRYYREAKVDIDPLVSSNLNLIVGNVMSIAKLDHALDGNRPPAYQSMTQEFLGEEVNLWLFFRPFQYYVLKNNRNYNKSEMVRIFPLPNINTLSLVQRCAIFHVVMWHKIAGIYCECVKNEFDNTGEIFVYVGNNRYLRLDCMDREDEFEYAYVESKESNKIEEMFRNIRTKRCITSSCSAEHILKFFGLESVKNDLLIYNSPSFLWAAESKLLSHPMLLWK